MLVGMTPSDQHHLPHLTPRAFTPSYQGYQPNYQFNWEPTLGPLPLLSESNRPVLPLRATTRTAAGVKTALPVPAGPSLILPIELAERGLAEPPSWPTDLPAPEEPSEPQIFRLAIEPSGLVKYCLSEGTSPPASLQQTIQRLRFQPKPGKTLQWAEVEVHW
jgi:hypothetical protein